MKTTEFWFWLMTDDWGRRRKSPCRFTEAEALKRDPTATRVDGSCVLIDVAETADEIAARAPKSPPGPAGHTPQKGETRGIRQSACPLVPPSG